MSSSWIDEINWDRVISTDVEFAAHIGNGKLHNMYATKQLQLELTLLSSRINLSLKQPASFCLSLLDFACCVQDEELAEQIGLLLVKLWPTLVERDKIFVVYRLDIMIRFRRHGTTQAILRKMGAIVALTLLKSLIVRDGKRHSASYRDPEDGHFINWYFETWCGLLAQDYHDLIRDLGKRMADLSRKTYVEFSWWEAQRTERLAARL